MTLIRTQKPNHSPFEEMFGRLLNDDLFTDFRGGSAQVPAVNMRDQEDKYSLELAVPGLSKNDFKIEVDNNLLTVSSHKEDQKEENKEGYFRKEFNFQSFKRSFSLPEGKVDENKIRAKYENGVLKIELPKSKEALPTPPKMIEIK